MADNVAAGIVWESDAPVEAAGSRVLRTIGDAGKLDLTLYIAMTVTIGIDFFWI